MENEKIPHEVIQLVKERLRAVPAHMELSVGSYGSFTRDELIERVDKQDEVGKAIVKMQLKGLQAFKEI